MAIAKEAKDLWRAAPCAGPLTVVADVYAFDFSVRAAYLDGLRGYFNGASVFLCPEGRADAPCEVEIVAPEGPAFASVARRDHVAECRRGAVGIRRVPRGELRRADRPSGGDGGFPGGLVRSRRRGARRRDHGQGQRGSRPAHDGSRAHLPVASRSLRRRAGIPGAVRPLSLPGRGGRRRLRRPRASLEHQPLLQARRAAGAGHGGRHRRLSKISRPREPRVLPQLEREADQARGVRSLRSRARELHAPALGVRGDHLLLRRPRACPMRRHRCRKLPRAPRAERSPAC